MILGDTNVKMLRMLSRWILSFLLVWITTSAEATIRVDQAVAGMDGYARQERWIPVVFQFHNSGADFQGTLEVSKGQTTFRKSLDLASGADKRVELILYYSGYYEQISYRILDNNRIVMENKLETRLLNYTDNLVMVISDGESNHQFMNGEQNPWGGKTFVVYLKSADLYSEWLAYSVADAVAIGIVSSREIPSSRWKALIQYAATGGTLVLSAGTDLSILKDPLLTENLPRISVPLSLSSNADFLASYWPSSSTSSSSPFPTVSIPVQRVDAGPEDGSLLALSTGESLITSSPYYKGNIIYFAFDYTRLPDSLRNIFARFWNTAVFPSRPDPPAFQNNFRKHLEELPRVQKYLYDIPGLKLPELKWFGLFFFVYFCFIGPLQFLLLKFLKKNSLMWFTFPGLVLLFSVLSFGYSEFRHTSHGKITQVAVVELYPALNQQITYQAYGTAISESGTFNFQAVPDNSYLRKFAQQAITYQPEPYTLSEDLPRTLVGENLKTWSFRTFDALSSQDIALPVEVRVRIVGDTVEGTVLNGTREPILESMFIYDSRNVAQLGVIEAGEKRSFRIALSHAVPPAGYPQAQVADLLDLYNPSYAAPHFFFGKQENLNGEISINGKSRKTQCTRFVSVFVSPDREDSEAAGKQ